MSSHIGIWIDHTQAVIVTLKEKDEAPEVETLHAHHAHTKETPHEIKGFYDAVIKKLESATAILIFGPGEAREELHKQFEGHHHAAQIVGVEPSDNLTENQIVAKVREHFIK